MMNTSRRNEIFPNVTDDEWNDWKWQTKNRITSVEQLKNYINLYNEEEQAINETSKLLKMSITPFYLTLIQKDDPKDPVYKQSIPTIFEVGKSPEELRDPRNEHKNMPVPGLRHRYLDRALLLINNHCAMYCRHCKRKRLVGQDDVSISMEQIEMGIEYIKKTPQIRDVLLSGGEPLLLSDEKLEHIIKKLREIPHVNHLLFSEEEQQEPLNRFE